MACTIKNSRLQKKKGKIVKKLQTKNLRAAVIRVKPFKVILSFQFFFFFYCLSLSVSSWIFAVKFSAVKIHAKRVHIGFMRECWFNNQETINRSHGRVCLVHWSRFCFDLLCDGDTDWIHGCFSTHWCTKQSKQIPEAVGLYITNGERANERRLGRIYVSIRKTRMITRRRI